MNPRLLIVDDDEEIRTQMKWALAQDYEVLLAEEDPLAVLGFRAIKPGSFGTIHDAEVLRVVFLA